MRPSANKEAALLWEIKSNEKLMVRQIACNKGGCRRCPHSYYAYATSGYGNARKHRYLGASNQFGMPRKKYTQSLFDSSTVMK